MINGEVLKALQNLNNLLTQKLLEAPNKSSQEQVNRELLLQTRVKIQETTSVFLRGDWQEKK